MTPGQICKIKISMAETELTIENTKYAIERLNIRLVENQIALKKLQQELDGI
jgi:uncharacterized coiled-coil protein SlyX